jgi:hypothetical protein
MVKVASVRKTENELEKAAAQVKSSIVIPSAFLGLVSILLGYGAVIYLMFKGGDLPVLITDSFILLFAGIVIGLAQCLYHRFLFDRFPEYYANRRRRAEALRSRNIKKMEIMTKPSHALGWSVPLFYIAGLGGALALIVFYSARLNPLAAVFLLLAGFYNLRFFFWKKKLGIK